MFAEVLHIRQSNATIFSDVLFFIFHWVKKQKTRTMPGFSEMTHKSDYLKIRGLNRISQSCALLNRYVAFTTSMLQR